jgi:hypothetical protein
MDAASVGAAEDDTATPLVEVKAGLGGCCRGAYTYRGHIVLIPVLNTTEREEQEGVR